MMVKMTISDAGHQTQAAMRVRLQNGSSWLAKQHNRYLANDPTAASNGKFGAALAAWTQLEQLWRCAVPTGCVMGEKARCNEGAVVKCDDCVEQPATGHHAK